jgi:hypothetical protein
MGLSKVNMKYRPLILFIRHDSAEVWEFRYGLKLGIVTLKIWPAPVFSCVSFVILAALLAVTQELLA